MVGRTESFTEVSWDEAYDYTARRFREIKQQFGPMPWQASLQPVYE
jgi:predicted molibdopterin-dependent oxidoreductase YjgC